MNEMLVYATKQPYPQLDNPLEFGLIKIKGIEDFFIAEIKDRKKMNKTRISQHSTMLTRLCLFCQVQVVSFCSFTIAIGTPIGVASTSISLVFLVKNGIVEFFLKTMGRKKANTN